MSDTTHGNNAFFSRIGNWFRRSNDSVNGNGHASVNGNGHYLAEGNGTAVAEPESNGTGSVDHAPGANGNGHLLPAAEPRLTFLKPKNRKDRDAAAIESLQVGVSALAHLMGDIREHLTRQADRQDKLAESQEQLVSYLAYLPHGLEALNENAAALNQHAAALNESAAAMAETTRMQGDALRETFASTQDSLRDTVGSTLFAIHQHVERQTSQQDQLAGILDRLTDMDSTSGKALTVLANRSQELTKHDQAITQNLRGIGAAMVSVGRSAQANTTVLEDIRNNISSRDRQVERILDRQNGRFTAVVACAITVSVATLAAVAFLGYLVLTKM